MAGNSILSTQVVKSANFRAFSTIQHGKVEAYLRNQETLNNIGYGEHRGQEKMEQYLDSWQKSYDKANHNLKNGIEDGKTVV
ncbi:MAG: hypothetical protein Q9187_002432 [Circinaria calcarea]